MAFAGVQSVFFVFLMFFSFSTPGNCQFPIGNGTLRALLQSPEILKALSQIPMGNSTLKDLLNSTAAQQALSRISQTLQQQMSWDSILKRISAPQLKLGACGDAIASLRNDKTGKMIKYLDAAGKPLSGLAFGNNLWMGSVDECQTIPDSHFCASAFSLSIPARVLGTPVTIPYIIWGGCFPKICNKKNVSTVLASYDSQVAKYGVYLKNHGAECPEPASYTTGSIVTLVFCGIILTFCLIGTITDMLIEAYDAQTEQPPAPTINEVELTVSTSSGLSKNHNTSSTTALTPAQVISKPWKKPSILDSFLSQFFLCFSLLRNTKKIFNTNVPPTAITSINGIRVISISWVILGHTFLMFVVSPLSTNKHSTGRDAKLLSIMPVINGFYSVDSFFFLSGLLVAYTCFRKMAKSDGKFNWILFYVHRIWRLTPSYMFVILFSTHLKRFLSDSPFWYTQYEDRLCTKYWWTNLLYINNFHPKEFGDECIGWSWYLANDMQFFAISPLLLICAYKYGWRGVAATAGSLLVISSVVIATLYGYYDLDPLTNMKVNHPRTSEFAKKQSQYQNYIYSKPYGRIQPYLVGFILGYFMYKKYGESRKPGWMLALIGWAVAFGIGMALVYAPHDSILPDGKEWSTGGNVIFGTFQRLLWGLALVWLTYACHYGYGGLIQEFLSAKFWIPLSRLTYSVYLIHLVVLSYMTMAAKGTFYYSLEVVSYYFLAACILSYGAGFILAVAIEYPCENLEYLALKALQKKRNRYNVSS